MQTAKNSGRILAQRCRNVSRCSEQSRFYCGLISCQLGVWSEVGIARGCPFHEREWRHRFICVPRTDTCEGSSTVCSLQVAQHLYHRYISIVYKNESKITSDCLSILPWRTTNAVGIIIDKIFDFRL
jgi:hypothetical protein